MERLLMTKANVQDEHSNNMQDFNSFTCIDKGFDVPTSFQFPKRCNLSLAWSYWLKGLILPDGTNIKPFRFLKKLPKKIANRYRTEFRPVLELLEEGVLLLHQSGIPSEYDMLTMEEVENFFNDGYAFLKSRMSFIFSDNSEKAVSKSEDTPNTHTLSHITPSHLTSNKKKKTTTSCDDDD